MNLPDLPLVVLDTETTGFVPKVNRVIEFASVRTEAGNVTDEYEQLISIPDEVPAVVATLTHIFDADLEGKPPFEELKEEIENRIGSDTIIVGQNVGFDIRMLRGEGIDLNDRPWIDTSMLASLVYPELESYSLGYISQVLNLNHEPVHRALGDVHATLELLSKCWERLLELPAELRGPLDAIMQKAPEGYQRLFAALPDATATSAPTWIGHFKKEEALHQAEETTAQIEPQGLGTVELLEESLDPAFLQQIIQKASEEDVQRWIAVKNVHSSIERFSLPDTVRAVHPPSYLLDQEAVEQFAQQETFTADEATLAVKLAWYEPTLRTELPLHGDEKFIWNGKLACTDASPAFAQQFENAPAVLLVNHWQLLQTLADDTHPAHKALTPETHIIVDDASMLEDTATKAYGWYFMLDDVRAAAKDNAQLTAFADVLQIWIERVRDFKDVRYLTKEDVGGILEIQRQLAEILEKNPLAANSPVAKQLQDLQKILNSDNIAGRITWIEQRPNGNQSLQSVPDRIDTFLQEHLYTQYSTTLLVPPDSQNALPQVLDRTTKTAVASNEESEGPAIAFNGDATADDFITSPLEGKTVLLMASRGRIEDVYVKHAHAAEENGITLICQGMSGGMGRMQAEFAAAEGTTVWVITPWTFENVQIPPESIDHLVIQSLPFDHPSHTILSKRAEHYTNAFGQYSLPRVRNRLYRLLRTFTRFGSANADVLFIDPRLETKSYGKDLWAYMKKLGHLEENEAPSREEKTEKADDSESQLSMF